MAPTPAEQGSLLSIFLLEAWDTVATLEEGMAVLRGPREATADAIDSLLVVSHRLKGSAALHGFPGLSELAGATEELLERAAHGSTELRGGAAAFLADLAPFLMVLFDRIGATGREDATAIAAFKGRHPALFAPSAIAASPPAEAPPAPTTDGEIDRVFRELRRFAAQDPEILGYFVPEATDHLEAMTAALLALERGDGAGEALAALLRAVHTLKGAAYTVGCAPVGDLAHEVEDLLVALREGRVPLAPPAIDGVLAGVDGMKILLGIAEGQAAPAPGALEESVRGLRRALRATAPADLPEAVPGGAPVSQSAAAAVDAVGTAPRVPAVPRIRVSLSRVDSLMALVGELVIARTRLQQRLGELERVEEQLGFNRSRLAQTVGAFEERHQVRPLPAVGSNGNGGVPDAAAGLEGYRPVAELFAELEFDRYDDVNLLARSVAEIAADLSELQAQAAGLVRGVREDAAEIQRLTARLRTEIARTRMVPVGTLFARFPRQVREAARGAGKQVALEVSGGSVEIDTSVIEQIADPLLHVVQNAIAHGIEPEDERRALGKPPCGTIHLRAHPLGGFIRVEVRDDGRGMDPEALRRAAAAQGFLPAERAALLSDREAIDLIFLPGFSTAPLVTTASGRGLGMDVVRTNVGRLNGDVEVATEAGVGTRITLKLPLTMLVSEALMVRAGAETLAVPMHAVKQVARVRREEVRLRDGGEVLHLEGLELPLVRLAPALGLRPVDGGGPLPVLVLRAAGQACALATDELLGKEEVVIKHLGPFLEDLAPYAGATITGEGRVALLLDPARLFEAAALGAVRLPGAVPAGPPPRPPEAARQVLLVDDSISVRKFVGQMLRKVGFRVTTAADGAEALQHLQEASFHAVITDLEMPRVNGYDLVGALRRRPATRNLPVVILTTRAGEKHRDLARRLGVEHYVTKPVDEQPFVRLVERITSSTPDAVTSGGTLR